MGAPAGGERTCRRGIHASKIHALDSRIPLSNSGPRGVRPEVPLAPAHSPAHGTPPAGTCVLYHLHRFIPHAASAWRGPASGKRRIRGTRPRGRGGWRAGRACVEGGDARGSCTTSTRPATHNTVASAASHPRRRTEPRSRAVASCVSLITLSHSAGAPVRCWTSAGRRPGGWTPRLAGGRGVVVRKRAGGGGGEGETAVKPRGWRGARRGR